MRSSWRASRLASLMVARAGRAWSGSSSRRWRATLACTLMSEMLWARTSCSSWARRSRCSPTRRCRSSSCRPLPLGRLLAAGADDLRHGQHHHQPARDQGQVQRARRRLGPGVDERGPRRSRRSRRRPGPTSARRRPAWTAANRATTTLTKIGPVGVAEADVDVGRGRRRPPPRRAASGPATARAAGPSEHEDEGEGVDGPRSGWLSAAPNEPTTWNRPMPSALSPHRGPRPRSHRPHAGNGRPATARRRPPGAAATAPAGVPRRRPPPTGKVVPARHRLCPQRRVRRTRSDPGGSSRRTAHSTSAPVSPAGRGTQQGPADHPGRGPHSGRTEEILQLRFRTRARNVE